MEVRKIIINIVLVLEILLMLFLITIVVNPIKLDKEEIDLSYGDKYTEVGFKAFKYFKDYTTDVKVINKINYKKLGKYKVIYKVTVLGIPYERVRIVNIVDNKKPSIELAGGKTTSVCPFKTYEEDGYKAIDDYDKDITKKVKIIKEKDKITYKVKDSSGNSFKIVRKIIYEDKEAPVITLDGDENITIIVGSDYNDKGATALDNCAGDISSKIEVEGSVDKDTVGEYKITYKVTDSSGNTATKERVVHVINRKKEAVLNDGKPGTIYLTFDDGPKEGTTNVILDILKEEGVKATFFVTNGGPDYLIKRENDEGHTVALHTASHNYATIYSSDEAYFNDLYSVQTRVKNITGYNSTIIRFPGGSSNTISRRYSPGIMSRLTSSVISKGFRYYDWNISSGDAGEVTSADGVYNNVVSRLKKERANMILMHDIKPYTRDALRRIIRYGRDAGYSFEKITDQTPMITQRVNN